MTRNVSPQLAGSVDGTVLPTLDRQPPILSALDRDRVRVLAKVFLAISNRLRERLPTIPIEIVEDISLNVARAFASCRDIKDLDKAFTLLSYEISPVVDGQVLAVVKLSRQGLQFIFPEPVEDVRQEFQHRHVMCLEGDCRRLPNAA